MSAAAGEVSLAIIASQENETNPESSRQLRLRALKNHINVSHEFSSSLDAASRQGSFLNDDRLCRAHDASFGAILAPEPLNLDAYFVDFKHTKNDQRNFYGATGQHTCPADTSISTVLTTQTVIIVISVLSPLALQKPSRS